MRKCVNGEYSDMTAEEIAAIEPPPGDIAPVEPSTDERLNALEQAMLDLILGG